MMSTIRACGNGLSILAATSLVMVTAAPASAQQQPVSDAGIITVTAGVEFLDHYMFRGFRQNSTASVIWPSAEFGVKAYSGDGTIESVGISVGSWNSLHTGDTGSGGPTGKSWYESRVSTTLRVAFGGGVSVATTYTTYTSPNNMFTTEKEIAVKLAIDDRAAALGRVAIQPYATVAFEIAAHPGEGQADGGLRAGRYLELGVAPGYATRRVRVAFPVKLGLSLSDYYELAGTDHTFGFASLGGTLTVPIHRTTRLGSWDVHGGVEYQMLGETTRVFNGGDRSRTIGSLGIGFSY